MSNQKEENTTNVQVKKWMFYCKLSIKNNIDIIGIIVSIWKRHKFETIFTYNDVLNIQDTIGKRFGSRKRTYVMVMNAYFYPKRKNIIYATPNYGPAKYKFEIDYYRQTYCFPENWLL